MTTETGIAATKEQDESSAIDVADGSSIQIWTNPGRLGPNESVTVWRTDGSVESPVVEGSDTAALTSRRPSLRLFGPGSFILKKTPTSDTITVFYDT